MKRDIYREVTDSIINAIEANPGKVVLPWHREGIMSIPTNVHSSNHYQGINIVSLWVSAMLHNYEHAYWGTYKQWAEKGAQVRKGEKSSLIIFYKELEIENDDGEKDKIPMARASAVFNVAQVDGYDIDIPDYGQIDRISQVDSFITATGAVIKPGGATAAYSPSGDYIKMPDEGRFVATEQSTRQEGYYSTLLHELTHWTGHKTRLDRDMTSRFGDEGYAMEELVAELGSSFLCAGLQIELVPRIDHAQYIAHWLQVLKNDKKAIFIAAAKAQAATKFLGL